eukprot:6213628-Pleurochrysis_carterae.AAC.5
MENSCTKFNNVIAPCNHAKRACTTAPYISDLDQWSNTARIQQNYKRRGTNEHCNMANANSSVVASADKATQPKTRGCHPSTLPKAKLQLPQMNKPDVKVRTTSRSRREIPQCLYVGRRLVRGDWIVGDYSD